MNPVRCRDVVKGEQFIPILFKVFHGLRVLVPESLQGAVKGFVSALTGLRQIEKPEPCRLRPAWRHNPGPAPASR